MITIVEPKEHIDKVWGKQKVHEADTYRMMRYVLRVNHDGKVLLHNVVTGRLVVLDQAEAETVEKLPMAYDPVMEQLVTEHYLVPEEYDEHQQVVNLRQILWSIEESHSSKDITYYTILPTTACNARCWYCYEQGIEPVTMSESTAYDVVEFIERSSGGKPVKIRWFGGEPTIAADRIDQISLGLRNRDINYSSIVTTNGYLFDEEMVDKAKYLWNTTQVTVSIDGTEENYNRVKAFPGVKDNPYHRMMHNVMLLLSRAINVAIRMNYDRETWRDFQALLKETQERFHNTLRLMVYPHQINTEMCIEEWPKMEAWLNQKNEELFDLASQFGHYRQELELPSLFFSMCEAASNSCVTIRPDGKIVCCPEQLDDNQVKGDLLQGITNKELLFSWKRFADHVRCRDCALYPRCSRLVNCLSGAHCSNRSSMFNQIRKLIKNCFLEKWTN